MSSETLQHLNTNTLIGFTDKRGNAWHYRQEEQGAESNHYVGAIPVEDVERRLFDWEGMSSPVQYTLPNGQGRTADDRQVIFRSDTGDALGVFKSGYQIHQYKPWLIGNVETIADSDLEIASAGLLKNGAQAWVQFELPETLVAAEGVQFRPFLGAATSMDGSLASTYFAGAQLVVCDNTLAAGLNGAAGKVRVKHSVRSLSRINDVRDALGIVYQVADQFQEEVDALTATVVTDAEWSAFVEAHTALGPNPTVRSVGMAERKAEELNGLWNADPRVSPWKGTAFGVLQAVNTHAHHFQTVRGASRVDRNMERAITGGVEKLDRSTLDLLATVQA